MMPAYLLLLALAPLLSCDAPGPLKADRDPGELFGPGEEELIVVDAVLIVDAPLPPVLVRRTEAPGNRYEAAATGVTGAEVSIRYGGALFEYRADPAQAGLYLPPDGAPRVEPGGEYELRVTSGDAPVVSARTLTPTRVRIEELVWLDEDLDTELQQLRLFSEIGDGVYDARENQLEYPRGLVVALIDDADETGFYQFATFNLERYSPYLLDPEWIDEGDFELERENTSPLLRAEDSYLYLPWDGIYHAGRYKVRLYSVDPELVRPRANGQHRRGPQRRRGGPVLPAAPLPRGERDRPLRLGLGRFLRLLRPAQGQPALLRVRVLGLRGGGGGGVTGGFWE